MKKLSALGAFVVVSLAPALVFACDDDVPGASALPGGSMLAYAAHELTASTQALAQILSAGGDQHVYEDAETLYDAAEHFEEEVLLGPEDLDVDFDAIEQTFEEMRDEFRASPCVQTNPAARSAWFQIAEANLHLRIAWFSHPIVSVGAVPPVVPPPVVPPPVVVPSFPGAGQPVFVPPPAPVFPPGRPYPFRF